jgi:hypothetical protein
MSTTYSRHGLLRRRPFAPVAEEPPPIDHTIVSDEDGEPIVSDEDGEPIVRG